MSVTLNNMPTSVTDVSVTLLDQSKLSELTTVKSADNNTVTSTYTYAGSSALFNTSVVVQSQYIPKDDICRHSIRLITTETNDASGVAVTRPIEALLAWNTPGRFMGDSTKVLAMLGAVYSLSFKTLVSKVPQPEWIRMVDLPNPAKLYP